MKTKLSPSQRAFRKREAARIRQQKCRQRKRLAKLKKLEMSQQSDNNGSVGIAASTKKLPENPGHKSKSKVDVTKASMPLLNERLQPPIKKRILTQESTSIELCDSFPSLNSETSSSSSSSLAKSDTTLQDDHVSPRAQLKLNTYSMHSPNPAALCTPEERRTPVNSSSGRRSTLVELKDQSTTSLSLSSCLFQSPGFGVVSPSDQHIELRKRKLNRIEEELLSSSSLPLTGNPITRRELRMSSSPPARRVLSNDLELEAVQTMLSLKSGFSATGSSTSTTSSNSSTTHYAGNYSNTIKIRQISEDSSIDNPRGYHPSRSSHDGIDHTSNINSSNYYIHDQHQGSVLVDQQEQEQYYYQKQQQNPFMVTTSPANSTSTTANATPRNHDIIVTNNSTSAFTSVVRTHFPQLKQTKPTTMKDFRRRHRYYD